MRLYVNMLTFLKYSFNTRPSLLGKFLFYARAVDSTMLYVLNDLATQQLTATQRTMEALDRLLDYAASNPTALLRFHPSEMQLLVHSDGSYLSAPEACSRAGGYYYLTTRTSQPADAPYNGAVHNIAKIMKNVMSSAAEAEVGALYMNAREAVPI